MTGGGDRESETTDSGLHRERASLPAGARVRSIRTTDGRRIAAFFEALSVESRGFFHPHPFDAATAEGIARGCGGSTPGIRLMVCVGPRMVGYAFAEGDPTMVGLAVADAWQNRGVGRALLCALHDEAAARGIQRLRLTVYKTNVRALHLYRSFGYRIVGEKLQGPSAGLEWVMEAEIDSHEETT